MPCNGAFIIVGSVSCFIHTEMNSDCCNWVMSSNNWQCRNKTLFISLPQVTTGGQLAAWTNNPMCGCVIECLSQSLPKVWHRMGRTGLTINRCTTLPLPGSQTSQHRSSDLTLTHRCRSRRCTFLPSWRQPTFYCFYWGRRPSPSWCCGAAVSSVARLTGGAGLDWPGDCNTRDTHSSPPTTSMTSPPSSPTREQLTISTS